MDRYLDKCINIFGQDFVGMKRDNFHLYIPKICKVYCSLIDEIANLSRESLSNNEANMIPHITTGNSLTRLLYQISKFGKIAGPKYMNTILDDLFEIFSKYETFMLDGLWTCERLDGCKVIDWYKYKPAYISWESPYEAMVIHNKPIDFKKMSIEKRIKFVIQPDLEMTILSSVVPPKDMLVLLLSLHQWKESL